MPLSVIWWIVLSFQQPGPLNSGSHRTPPANAGGSDKNCPPTSLTAEQDKVGGLETIRVYNASMKILNFTVVMTPDVTGGYVVTCPALPGLVTEGDTLEEARAMATDAIQGYLESLKKDGEPIPKDESITEQLAIEVA